VRDRPGFDELEPPAREPARLDGLTEEEWAARRLRRERLFRAIFGLAFGFGVAVLAIWHWGLFQPRMRVASAFVIAGSMILFATLFARRRDDEALDYAGWIAFPEWKAVEKMPWWMIICIGVALFLVLALFGIVLVLGRLPWPA
jgi:hypothetical protein